MTEAPELSFEHLRQWGFAPGSYVCFCSECEKRHTADKRAWRCLECAEARALPPSVGREEIADKAKLKEMAWTRIFGENVVKTPQRAVIISKVLDYIDAVLALTPAPVAGWQVNPLVRKPCKGGEKAESIFGDVMFSFDGEYIDDELHQAIQVDMPWGECEVFSYIDDADDWADEQIKARIFSAFTRAPSPTEQPDPVKAAARVLLDELKIVEPARPEWAIAVKTWLDTRERYGSSAPRALTGENET